MGKITRWVIHMLGGVTVGEALTLEDRLAAKSNELEILRGSIETWHAEARGMTNTAEEMHRRREEAKEQLLRCLADSRAIKCSWRYDEVSREHICRAIIRTVK